MQVTQDDEEQQYGDAVSPQLLRAVLTTRRAWDPYHWDTRCQTPEDALLGILFAVHVQSNEDLYVDVIGPYDCPFCTKLVTVLGVFSGSRR